MADKRRLLSIDLETFSDVDLAKCGVYRYVEGDFHILLFAYAFDNEETKIVDLACGEKLPQEVVDAIFDRKKWLIEHADEIRKAEEKRIQQEAEDKIRIETQMKRMEEQKFYDGFEEVKNSFNQQEKIIRDKYGIRWIQCERCGKIGQEGEFVSYGGKNHVNLGVCKKCNNGR